ncbi:hypothetical protein [Nostoc sp. CALU 546]|uniref:hypothetical protein n=1 Tax=Nostoc sp. CALU 546 TaxID=1867241 RepID=UPI003B6811C7
MNQILTLAIANDTLLDWGLGTGDWGLGKQTESSFLLTQHSARAKRPATANSTHHS